MKKKFLEKRSNFKQPLKVTPFYEKFLGEMTEGYWYDWSGYKAARVIQAHELEYFAIR